MSHPIEFPKKIAKFLQILILISVLDVRGGCTDRHRDQFVHAHPSHVFTKRCHRLLPDN